jgi:hypothetical protein
MLLNERDPLTVPTETVTSRCKHVRKATKTERERKRGRAAINVSSHPSKVTCIDFLRQWENAPTLFNDR